MQTFTNFQAKKVPSNLQYPTWLNELEPKPWNEQFCAIDVHFKQMDKNEMHSLWLKICGDGAL